MKKLLSISLLVLCLQTKSQAQTQFPFYGFELSNYEVGDTLEYYSNSDQYYYYVYNDQYAVHVIIDKQSISSNLIKYVSKVVYSGASSYGKFPPQYESYQGAQTNEIEISNDTIYCNDNNYLGITLEQLDTTSYSFVPLDSVYVKYDTINGLKRIKKEVSGFDLSLYDYSYEAIENIGIIYHTHDSIIEVGGGKSNSTRLVYAHLAHYGIYGQYYELYDNTNDIEVSKTKVSIQYESDGNIFLLLSSNEKLKQPLLSVHDLLGRKIKTIPVTVGYNPIDMSNLPKGMYLYKVESDGKILGQGKLMSF